MCDLNLGKAFLEVSIELLIQLVLITVIGGSIFRWLYLRFQTARLFLTLFPDRPDDSLKGTWRVGGYDISFPEEYLDYSSKLKYDGEVLFKIKGRTVFIDGALNAKSDPAEGEVDVNWKFEGRGQVDGEHLMIAYKLRIIPSGNSPFPYKDTIGSMIVKFEYAFADASGFFLARRSIRGEDVNRFGIALGGSTNGED